MWKSWWRVIIIIKVNPNTKNNFKSILYSYPWPYRWVSTSINKKIHIFSVLQSGSFLCCSRNSSCFDFSSFIQPLLKYCKRWFSCICCRNSLQSIHSCWFCVFTLYIIERNYIKYLSWKKYRKFSWKNFWQTNFSKSTSNLNFISWKIVHIFVRPYWKNR